MRPTKSICTMWVVRGLRPLRLLDDRCALLAQALERTLHVLDAHRDRRSPPRKAGELRQREAGLHLDARGVAKREARLWGLGLDRRLGDRSSVPLWLSASANVSLTSARSISSSTLAPYSFSNTERGALPVGSPERERALRDPDRFDRRLRATRSAATSTSSVRTTEDRLCGFDAHRRRRGRAVFALGQESSTTRRWLRRPPSHRRCKAGCRGQDSNLHVLSDSGS